MRLCKFWASILPRELFPGLGLDSCGSFQRRIQPRSFLCPPMSEFLFLPQLQALCLLPHCLSGWPPWQAVVAQVAAPPALTSLISFPQAVFHSQPVQQELKDRLTII